MITQAHKRFLESVQKLLKEDFDLYSARTQDMINKPFYMPVYYSNNTGMLDLSKRNGRTLEVYGGSLYFEEADELQNRETLVEEYYFLTEIDQEDATLVCSPDDSYPPHCVMSYPSDRVIDPLGVDIRYTDWLWVRLTQEAFDKLTPEEKMLPFGKQKMKNMDYGILGEKNMD